MPLKIFRTMKVVKKFPLLEIWKNSAQGLLRYSDVYKTACCPTLTLELTMLNLFLDYISKLYI